ncbi:DUF5677 domain-containing protein [Brevundimonas fontaquae]|uniref:Uncharacterized protein n=1 Tax=Brevundimonas fontaquae TaxID=2813778 RepID=A0ABX7LT14_9CAUL|nr:DUF5677 domain-containing protein [Brevundimonas fontaquae]QSF54870.1 hypothetical protein JX001_03390 [Brevundimonas fontaquae]
MIERKDADPREALADEGLLSPEIETWRQIYVDNYRDWFKLSRELNRYAVSLFQDHQDAGEGGPANAAAPTAVRIFGRALNAYTASIMLAERAMTIEAVGAVRPIHEAGFWLSLLATNPEKALEELDIDHHKHAVDREQLLRAAYPGNEELHSASVEREAAHAALLGKRRPISMKALAASLPGDPGYLQYRLASGFYGHLSHNSLDALKLQTGDKGVRPILGPFETEIPKALFFAIDAMARTTRYFAALVKASDASDIISGFRTRLADLGNADAETKSQDR